MDGQRSVTIRVQDLALQRLDPDMGGGAEHMRAFYKHRHRILGIADKKYSQGLIEPNDTVSVLDADIA